MLMSSTLLIVVAVLQLLKATVEAACYSVRGVLIKDDIPCSSDNDSLCCGPNSLCLSNHMCFDGDYHVLTKGVSQ